MNPTDPNLQNAVQHSWVRFLDTFEPLRPDLYRYCRNLTRSPWDADDLVQDVLARAFVTLGAMHHGPPDNPRAWLFRVASNLWIDRVRQRREPLAPEEAAARAPDARGAREAAGTLLSRLSPQERAAVVLKDAFDLSLEEVAEVLTTSVGAVKAALHGGRGKLARDESGAGPQRPTPEVAVINAFVEAFNAGDLDRLTSLLLEGAEVEVVRASVDRGREQARHGALYGMLFGTARMSGVDPAGGMDPAFRAGVLHERPRLELRVHRDEPLLLHWYRHADGEHVRALTRVEAEGGAVTRLRNYFFTPDVLEEVCRELGVPFRSNGTEWCGRPCELIATREIAASRERVFAAFADPVALARWWGPRGFTNTFEVCEFRPGGPWRFVMHAPNGATFPNESEFAEIVPNERVVVLHRSSPRFRLQVTFEALGERTRVTWRQVFEDEREFEKMKGLASEGNVQNLERLAAEVEGR